MIVRMSDFKSNEYSNLLGGSEFEPHEENPMLGFRGASRYISPVFEDCFELETQAIKRVRHEMGLKNVEVMIPFVRTTGEAEAVIESAREIWFTPWRTRFESDHDVRAAFERGSRR
uniref:putative PEP-binding protein n=1 Tax=Vibrio cholerae TaxID=666 RepID=UPI003F58902F